MDSAKRNNVKLLAAVIGSSALIAMGAVSAMVVHEAGPAVKGTAPLPSEEQGPAAP